MRGGLFGMFAEAGLQFPHPLLEKRRLLRQRLSFSENTETMQEMLSSMNSTKARTIRKTRFETSST